MNKNTKDLKFSVKKCAIIALFFALLFMLMSGKVSAAESVQGLYKVDGDYITRVLPKTTVKDLINNLELSDSVTVQVIDKDGKILEDADLVGTGMTLKLNENNYKIVVLGDVLGNGKVSITDVVRARLDFISIINLEEIYQKAIDINGDGNKTITDLTQMNLSLIGLIDIVAPNSFVPTATSTINSITLSGETIDRNADEIIEYYFKINDGEWVQNQDKTKSEYTFTGLTQDTTYSLKMKVKDESGNEKITQSVKMSTAGFPITVNEVENGIEINVGIDSTAYNIKEYDYQIERTYWKWNKVSEEKSYTFSNLVEGEVYTVRVIAINNDGNRIESGDAKIKLKSKPTLKINPNGGFYESSKEIQEFKNAEGEVLKVEVPKRDGFVFLGWTVEGEGNVERKTEEVELENGETTTHAYYEYIYGQRNTTITANWRQVEFVYASLYSDGTLRFSSKDDIISGKDVVNRYGEIFAREYKFGEEGYGNNTEEDYYNLPPWYADREKITKVEFANEISPVSTKCWFMECENLETIENMKNLDTSRVTDMGWMFARCRKLTSIDLSNFDTSNVTNMWDMFYLCESLTSIDLSNFDTSNVTQMRSLFHGCSGLTSIDVSGFNTSKVTDMNNMFARCSSLETVDISNFDTSNVTTMRDMFNNSYSENHGGKAENKLKSIIFGSNFDTSKVENMQNMFYGSNNLTSIDLSNFNTSSVTTMQGMFYGCSGLTSIDLSGLDTSNVTLMNYMFYGCSGLTSIDLSNFDTSNVEDMGYMFNGCASLTDAEMLKIIGKLDTSNVTAMNQLFRDCTGLTNDGINAIIEKLDTSNVTSIGGMFWGCTGLISIDLSVLDTSKLEWMDHLFEGCTNLTSVNLSGLDTSNLTNMGYMFEGCSSINDEEMKKIIDTISKLDTSNVTDMYRVFGNCTGITEIDISSLDISKVTNVSGMFFGCSGLTKIELGELDTSKIENMQHLFRRMQ